MSHEQEQERLLDRDARGEDNYTPKDESNVNSGPLQSVCIPNRRPRPEINKTRYYKNILYHYKCNKYYQVVWVVVGHCALLT